MMIILLILITLSLDSVWILLGENCCWSLLGLKGLTFCKHGLVSLFAVRTMPLCVYKELSVELDLT